jgi:integrase
MVSLTASPSIGISSAMARSFTNRDLARKIHGERTVSEPQDRVTELIEQQTAILEVLRSIASSPDDLQPIFDAILDSAVYKSLLPLLVGSHIRSGEVGGWGWPHGLPRSPRHIQLAKGTVCQRAGHEVVQEVLSVKQELFASLDRLCDPKIVLGTKEENSPRRRPLSYSPPPHIHAPI